MQPGLQRFLSSLTQALEGDLCCPMASMPKRTCLSCGLRLCMYNYNDYCFGCLSKGMVKVSRHRITTKGKAYANQSEKNHMAYIKNRTKIRLKAKLRYQESERLE